MRLRHAQNPLSQAKGAHRAPFITTENILFMGLQS